MALRNPLLLLGLAGALALGCNDKLPAPDPKGKDLVAGAVVAATTTAETTPGMRIYKVVHVDDYPEPVGHNLHLIAYDPKAPSFEDARDLRRRGTMTVLLPHFEVRLTDFIQRDHRVIASEPVTDAERKPYEKARDIHK